MIRGCTYQVLPIDKELQSYTFEVDFKRMKYYNKAYGDKHNFTFREFFVCREHHCNDNGNQLFADFLVLIFMLLLLEKISNSYFVII